MKFAVIGGDMRQVKLSGLLALDGHEVSVFGTEKIQPERGTIYYNSVQEAIEGADCIILPLPVINREDVLNTPLSNTMHTLKEVLTPIKPGQIVCAGRISEKTAETARQMSIPLIDYFSREELAVANAAATAEGAIQMIMEEIPITICGSKCLVIGFGRIGKFLARRLWGCGAQVTVSARKYVDVAWIRALGYQALWTPELDGKLSDFDIIINTVPARVLGEKRLREVQDGCLCLDLASKPGGMDFTAASKIGVKAVWALSLPGEVAPVTSGMAIRDTIYNILEEQGVK